jgi:hypothetical protein
MLSSRWALARNDPLVTAREGGEAILLRLRMHHMMVRMHRIDAQTPAEVPVCLGARRHKRVTGVPMSHVCAVLAPVVQTSSSATRPGSSSNVDRQRRSGSEDESWRHSARWDHAVVEGSLQCRLAPP